MSWRPLRRRRERVGRAREKRIESIRPRRNSFALEVSIGLLLPPLALSQEWAPRLPSTAARRSYARSSSLGQAGAHLPCLSAGARVCSAADGELGLAYNDK